MRRMLLSALAVTIIVFPIGWRWSVMAQQPDPLVGKWTVNVAKSKYDPGPPPKSVTRTNVDRGNDWFLFTQEGVNPDGTSFLNTGAFKADGQDYPFVIKGVATGVWTVALKRSDRYTYDYTLKLDGKPVNSVHGVVSKDGKSLTETGKGTDAQGKPTAATILFEKQ